MKLVPPSGASIRVMLGVVETRLLLMREAMPSVTLSEVMAVKVQSGLYVWLAGTGQATERAVARLPPEWVQCGGKGNPSEKKVYTHKPPPARPTGCEQPAFLRQ